MAEISKDSLLRSWKEIAAYLGCDVRTCHRWEGKRGMPVHRAEGGESKSPVFAYKDELDAWFKETFRSANETAKKAGDVHPWLKWALGGAAVIILAGAFLREGGILAKRQPADFAIDGSSLVILDKQKQELWRRDTGMEDLQPEDFYRRFFQVKNTGESNILPTLIITDINADGDAEVLFAPRRRSDQTGEGWLYCYDRKGTVFWKFRCEKELRCKEVVYSPDYRIAGFYCQDMDGDGRLETVVESFQAPDWPCQLAVLDASGNRIGEFWNAGYLRDLVFHDINGDGREELIVCGVNNEYKGGCLIVFDTRRIAGSSPQTGEYACEGLDPGSMLYYVTTPYSEVSKARGHPVEGFAQVCITKNSRIRGTMGTAMIFEFGFDLACLQVKPGNGFISRHTEMVEAGKISTVIDDAYLAAEKAGVRWWEGSGFVDRPARNARAPF